MLKPYQMNYWKTAVMILILFATEFNFAQVKEKVGYGPDTLHCVMLDTYLIKKDVKNLEELLHPNLSLGHSNGWIETKESLLATLPTSKVEYHQFTYHGSPIITFENDEIKSMRRNLTAFGKLGEVEFQVDLKILEVWILEKGEWKLLSRQSVEVDFDS
jgi:hypothetical protein